MRKNTILHLLRGTLGMPLVYLGIALLVIHCLCHLRTNGVLILAIALEIVGVACHYWRVKHNK